MATATSASSSCRRYPPPSEDEDEDELGALIYNSSQTARLAKRLRGEGIRGGQADSPDDNVPGHHRPHDRDHPSLATPNPVSSLGYDPRAQFQGHAHARAEAQAQALVSSLSHDPRAQARALAAAAARSLTARDVFAGDILEGLRRDDYDDDASAAAAISRAGPRPQPQSQPTQSKKRKLEDALNESLNRRKLEDAARRSSDRSPPSLETETALIGRTSFAEEAALLSSSAWTRFATAGPPPRERPSPQSSCQQIHPPLPLRDVAGRSPNDGRYPSLETRALGETGGAFYGGLLPPRGHGSGVVGGGRCGRTNGGGYGCDYDDNVILKTLSAMLTGVPNAPPVPPPTVPKTTPPLYDSWYQPSQGAPPVDTRPTKIFRKIADQAKAMRTLRELMRTPDLPLGGSATDSTGPTNGGDVAATQRAKAARTFEDLVRTADFAAGRGVTGGGGEESPTTTMDGGSRGSWGTTPSIHSMGQSRSSPSMPNAISDDAPARPAKGDLDGGGGGHSEASYEVLAARIRALASGAADPGGEGPRDKPGAGGMRGTDDAANASSWAARSPALVGDGPRGLTSEAKLTLALECEKLRIMSAVPPPVPGSGKHCENRLAKLANLPGCGESGKKLALERLRSGNAPQKGAFKLTVETPEQPPASGPGNAELGSIHLENKLQRLGGMALKLLAQTSKQHSAPGFGDADIGRSNFVDDLATGSMRMGAVPPAAPAHELPAQTSKHPPAPGYGNGNANADPSRSNLENELATGSMRMGAMPPAAPAHKLPAHTSKHPPAPGLCDADPSRSNLENGLAMGSMRMGTMPQTDRALRLPDQTPNQPPASVLDNADPGNINLQNKLATGSPRMGSMPYTAGAFQVPAQASEQPPASEDFDNADRVSGNPGNELAMGSRPSPVSVLGNADPGGRNLQNKLAVGSPSMGLMPCAAQALKLLAQTSKQPPASSLGNADSVSSDLENKLPMGSPRMGTVPHTAAGHELPAQTSNQPPASGPVDTGPGRGKPENKLAVGSPRMGTMPHTASSHKLSALASNHPSASGLVNSDTGACNPGNKSSMESLRIGSLPHTARAFELPASGMGNADLGSDSSDVKLATGTRRIGALPNTLQAPTQPTLALSNADPASGVSDYKSATGIKAGTLPNSLQTSKQPPALGLGNADPGSRSPSAVHAVIGSQAEDSMSVTTGVPKQPDLGNANPGTGNSGVDRADVERRRIDRMHNPEGVLKQPALENSHQCGARSCVNHTATSSHGTDVKSPTNRPLIHPALVNANLGSVNSDVNHAALMYCRSLANRTPQPALGNANPGSGVSCVNHAPMGSHRIGSTPPMNGAPVQPSLGNVSGSSDVNQAATAYCMSLLHGDPKQSTLGTADPGSGISGIDLAAMGNHKIDSMPTTNGVLELPASDNVNPERDCVMNRQRIADMLLSAGISSQLGCGLENNDAAGKSQGLDSIPNKSPILDNADHVSCSSDVECTATEKQRIDRALITDGALKQPTLGNANPRSTISEVNRSDVGTERMDGLFGTDGASKQPTSGNANPSGGSSDVNLAAMGSQMVDHMSITDGAFKQHALGTEIPSSGNSRVIDNILIADEFKQPTLGNASRGSQSCQNNDAPMIPRERKLSIDSNSMCDSACDGQRCRVGPKKSFLRREREKMSKSQAVGNDFEFCESEFFKSFVIEDTPVACSHLECANQAIHNGVCWKHGEKGTHSCPFFGCENDPEEGGICAKHDTEIKTYSHKGYTNRAKKKGVCKLHGADRKMCTQCNNFAFGGDLCIKHGGKIVKSCFHERCIGGTIKGEACWKCMYKLWATN